MYPRRLGFALILILGTLLGQDAAPSVQITGAVKQPLTLTVEDLGKMPRASVKTTSGDTQTRYDGVWLHEVLKRAGVPQGCGFTRKGVGGLRSRRGAGRISGGILARGTRPHLYRQRNTIGGYRQRKALFGAQGRFRLVVPKDKPGARS